MLDFQDSRYSGSGRESARKNDALSGIGAREVRLGWTVKLYWAVALAALAGGGPAGDCLAQSFQQPFELGLAMLHPPQAI